MSQVSNGHGSKVDLETNPIPDKASLHFVALLGNSEASLSRFLQALGPRSEAPLPRGSRVGDAAEGLGAVQQGVWTAVDRPRPCTYTDLTIGDWQFRLVFDPEGLPPVIQETVFPEDPSFEVKEIVTNHHGSCLVFLTSSPAPSQTDPGPEGWLRFQGLAQLAWAWLDAGAELICFPEGRAYLPRRVLLHLEPELLTPEHSYLFITNGVAHTFTRQGKKNVWVRTWGMAQFGLPDLAAQVTLEGHPEILENTMQSLRLFMETLPPAMIRDHGILPKGGSVQVGKASWTAQGAPHLSEQSYLGSRFGIQIFEQTTI